LLLLPSPTQAGARLTASRSWRHTSLNGVDNTRKIVRMGADIREQRDGDADEVAQVITAAFADHGHVAGLAAALRARPDNQASLVAVDSGRVVGHTHLSISWVDARHHLFEVLTLSPLSVAPDRQSQGIGSRLLAQARQTAEQLGAPLLFLEGDPIYYAKCGWLSAEVLGFAPPSRRIPARAFRVMPLAMYDREAMRGALIYNDTFWAHDSVGLRE
jgi:putative acetyltransferase